MRTATPELTADIANGCTTLAHLLRITRKDGTIIRLTDATDDLTVGGFTYESDPSFTTSAIFTSSSMMTAQNVTLTMPLSTGAVEEAHVRARRYNGAKAELFLVNYENTAHGTMTLFSGTFGQIRLCDKQCIAVEIQPAGAAFGSKSLGGEVYQATCRNSLGDSKCTKDLNALRLAFIVDTVPTTASFTASELTTEPNEYFTQGFVEWSTGANAGLRSMIAKSVQATDTITLTTAPPNAIAIGDTGFLYPGCDKLAETCHTKFANIVNFNGEPHVPSQDIVQPSAVSYTRPGGIAG